MPVIKVTNTVEAVDNMVEAFNTFWANQAIRTSVAYDNIDFNAAEQSLPLQGAEGEGVVLLKVMHSSGDIAALGTRLHRKQGILLIAVYVNGGEGRKRVGGLIADQADNFLSTELISGVTLESPAINEVGASGKWWQINVFANFKYDIVRG